MPGELPAAEIVNYEDFSRMINEYRAVFGSARVPLMSVLQYWWKWNETYIYGLQGPGQYEDYDYANGYPDWKEATVGFIYPMLKLWGVLMMSITGDQSEYSVAEITDSSLIMGTEAESETGFPYPLSLQRGFTTRNGVFHPARPPIIKTPEQLDAMAKIFLDTTKRQIENIKGV